MSFAGDFFLRLDPDSGYEYRPAEPPLSYTSQGGQRFVLDEVFATDLVSTPRLLWSIPGYAKDDFPRAGLIHDWLYEQHHRGIDLVGFAQANSLLEEMCRAEGAPRWQAWSYKIACNLGGWALWNKNWWSAPATATYDLVALKTAADLMSSGQWSKLNSLFVRMDFSLLSPAAFETWFAVTNHPEIAKKLPSLAAAKQRALLFLRPKSSAQAELFALKYSRIGV